MLPLSVFNPLHVTVKCLQQVAACGNRCRGILPHADCHSKRAHVLLFRKYGCLLITVKLVRLNQTQIKL